MEQARMDRLEARIRQLGNASMAGSYDVILREVEPVLMAMLREKGIGELFGPGTPTTALIDYIRQWFESRQQQRA